MLSDLLPPGASGGDPLRLWHKAEAQTASIELEGLLSGSGQSVVESLAVEALPEGEDEEALIARVQGELEGLGFLKVGNRCGVGLFCF